ncbi:hypothetical protein BH23ACT6_BH23ACT6_04050 [soil metagenome]
MAARLLNDPDIGFGEMHQHWIGASTWRWTRTLNRHDIESEAAERPAVHHDLVFHGVDTIAEVHLGGVLLGKTDDQHVRYRWPLPPADGGYADVSDDPEELSVTIHPVYPVALKAQEQVGPLPRPYTVPYPYVRKSACNFGWDWGPSYLTAGIWRPVELQSYGRGRIESLRVLSGTQGTDDHLVAAISVAADLHCPEDIDGLSMRVTVRGPDGSTCVTETAAAQPCADGATQAQVDVSIEAPAVWQPVGYGNQPLYDVLVELVLHEQVLHSETRRTGLRTTEVHEPRDSQGQRWHLVINGRRIRVRGYNWIPDDPFIAEVTPARTRRRLDQAVAGGANMIRVWGGGYVVDEDFMAACDERGLLVWHDFMFACSAYDESPQMLAKITMEAEQAVTALSPHPSLVLWCGGNECVWGWHSWDWQPELGGRSWGSAHLRRTPAGRGGPVGSRTALHRQQPVVRRGGPRPVRSSTRPGPPVGAVERRRLRPLPQRRPGVRLGDGLVCPASLDHPSTRCAAG